jgi:protein-S-isoprenylcysteine O-methyltransferase Ste14
MRRSLETVLATILVPGIFVFLLPYLILTASGTGWPAEPSALQLLAIPLALFGGSMAVWVSYTFATKGEGTPIPVDPPRQFIDFGLFRYVRNPMVLGVVIALLAEAIFFASVWLLLYTIVVWFVLHLFVVMVEEPQLERRFGESYQRYRETTPRWLPRRRRRGESGRTEPKG